MKCSHLQSLNSFIFGHFALKNNLNYKQIIIYMLTVYFIYFQHWMEEQLKSVILV